MAKHAYIELLIALGCGGLAIGGGGCRSDEKKSEPETTLAATEGVSSAKGEPSPAPAPAGANPACSKAEACCRAMVKKLPTAQQNFAPCAEVHKMDQSNCVPMYEKYRQAAQGLGVTCD